MRALRFHDRRDLRLEEMATPEPGPGEVRIRVTDAGLSQTQVNEFMEGPFIISQDEHPLTGHAGPIVPCQEYGGEIDLVGEGVDAGMIGRRVAALPAITCGTCRTCLDGHDNVCEKLAYRGVLGADGGFCEYSVLPVGDVLEVSDRNQLSFVEPLLLGVHSSKRFETPRDGKALIIGAGAVGVAIAAIWQDCLGLEVTLLDVLPGRVERANLAGLTATTDVPEPGEFSIVVDAAGKDTTHNTDALLQGIDLCRAGGSVVALGAYFSPQEFMSMPIVFSERSIVSSFAYDKTDVEDFRIWKDKITVNFDPVVSRVPLERLIEDGYYQAELDRDSFTRIVTGADD